MFAFLENIGTTELLIVGIAALLVFGKRLPEVASQAGSALARFKRDLNKTWDDTGMEREIRKIKESLPTDLSVSDMARIATDRMDKRIRENMAEAEKAMTFDPFAPALPPAPGEPPAGSASADPTSATPTNGTPPSNERPPHVPPATSADPSPSSDPALAPSPAPSTGGPAAAGGPPQPGIDPAKHFGPPNSVPREG